MDIRPGETLNGPRGSQVTVDSFLGSGGFGQVFKGYLADGTPVAIKTVLTSILDPDELRTFQNEARCSQEVSHPNVVQVLHVSDGNDASGRPPYLVLEFVDGGNLRDVIKAHQSAGSKPSPTELRAMYLEIAEGMRAINRKIVHRDLKPENVLVDNAASRLKIADFGLAKLVGAATRSETFKGWGTRPYQAPEAFEYGPNDVAMDIYAAGVTFFELATLDWPVQPASGDNSPLAWRNAHLFKSPSNLRVMRPDAPDDLIQLIALMLQKDPSRRPSSWDVVIERLQKQPNEKEGQPDVSALVQKATATLLQRIAEETRLREQTEKQGERFALLQHAFNEPVETLRSVVNAFNDASEVGKLSLKEQGSLSAEVASSHTGSRLVLEARVIDDLNVGPNDIFRLIGIARIDPMPRLANRNDFYRNQESFGSFNLGYKVNHSRDKFGTWSVFRFEHSPIMGKVGSPRWFALDFHELPRQLAALNAMGIYQHQQGQLDHEWFRLLLEHLM
jgi:eukaryotic-like serine/threonine-protein kinase